MKNLTLKTALLFSVFMSAIGCSNHSTPETSKMTEAYLDAKVVYGNDNRIEYYQASEKYKTLAKSTVALFKKSGLLKQSDGSYQIIGKTFGVSHALCAAEPFREQTTAAFCSGSLVAEDIIMTAGHCISTVANCNDVQFVFDFNVNETGETKRVPADNVYSCKEVIHSEQAANGADFALIKLTRKVVGRSALKLRTSGEAKIGDSLVVIGHPVGLPQKIAGGASVRSIKGEFLVANLDTYGGNSGSAVFNADSGLIEGILVRGENDFVSQGTCRVSYRCTDDSCRGEDVTKVSKALSFIADLKPEPPIDTPAVDVFASSTQASIPDNVEAGIQSAISSGAKIPQGRKVLVKVDVAHTWRGDLILELTSPSGAKVLLHNRSGGSLDHIAGTFGEDLASAQSLAALSAETKAGNWILKVSDRARVDVGTLKSWSLIFK